MNTMMRMQKGRRTKITINLDDFEFCGFGQAGTSLRPIVRYHEQSGATIHQTLGNGIQFPKLLNSSNWAGQL